MTEIWEYIQQANQAFWGRSVYHIWFYAAALLIILLEKCPVKKRIIGIYPVCFIICLFNPVAYYLVKTYTTGIWQYFARLYSMIPLPVTLGLGTVLLIDLVCTKKPKHAADRIVPQGDSSSGYQDRAVLRLILTGCFCGVIILGGTNVYEQDWFQPAQNHEKVPEDVIGICRELHRDEGVTIAVPSALSRYVRQIDASFYMPYSRFIDDLGRELDKTTPDPIYAMEEAGREGCDYIVVYNNDLNLMDFDSCGWSPCFVQGDYLVYTVENVNRIKNEYNSNRQLIRQTKLDADGKSRAEAFGYSSKGYEYDERGIPQSEVYYDAEGKLIGRTGAGGDQEENALRFYNFTDGVSRDKKGRIVFTTAVEDNKFLCVQLQLISQDKTRHLLSFGKSESVTKVTGEYLHELPDGLYYLRLKANTNLADEYIDSLVYLKQGDRIVYRYTVNKLKSDRIVISHLSAGIWHETDQ